MLGYICGFNGGNKSLRRLIESKWKLKRDHLFCNGSRDPIHWVQYGSTVISELNNEFHN